MQSSRRQMLMGSASPKKQSAVPQTRAAADSMQLGKRTTRMQASKEGGVDKVNKADDIEFEKLMGNNYGANKRSRPAEVIPEVVQK